MSTLANIESALRFRLGNKKGFEADFLREIRFAQKRLEEDPTIRYWFLLQFSSIVLTPGQHTIPFPEGFLREYDDLLPYYEEDGVRIDLNRVDLDDAQHMFGTWSGAPQVYIMIDNLLQIYPKPDKAYTIIFPHMKREPTLGDGVLENEWTREAEQVLLNKAGIALAQGFRDMEALQNFTNDFQAAFRELIIRVTQREESNMVRQRRAGDALGK